MRKCFAVNIQKKDENNNKSCETAFGSLKMQTKFETLSVILIRRLDHMHKK